MTLFVDGRACARARGLRWLVLVLLGGCSTGDVIANLFAVVVCVLAVIGAVTVLFGSVTVENTEGARVWRLVRDAPDDEVVLAAVVSWACARQSEGVTVTGSEVLRVIARARQPNPREGKRGAT